MQTTTGPLDPRNSKFLRREKLRLKLQARIRSEAHFLSGRHAQLMELFRLGRIVSEFLKGLFSLHPMGPAVTIFGSARFERDHRYCALAKEAGRLLAREGFTIMTGGGPGIMEAANEGSKEGGGVSIGCNIVVPHEQTPNRFLDRVITFNYFFVRKVMLVKYSYAFVIFPGGMGTLDEMTEAMTLIQTGKLYNFPVILMGSDYWEGFMDWVRNTVIPSGAMSEDDLDFLHLSDSPEQMIEIIRSATQGLGLRLRAITPTGE